MWSKGQAGVRKEWKEGKASKETQGMIETAWQSVRIAHGRSLVSIPESQALPWRKRPLPGGGLGIVVNIIDTSVGQLSLFPSGK